MRCKHTLVIIYQSETAGKLACTFSIRIDQIMVKLIRDALQFDRIYISNDKLLAVLNPYPYGPYLHRHNIRK